MRIAIIQESIDPGRGGAETSTLEMARRLVETGAEVDLLSADGLPPQQTPAGVRIDALAPASTALTKLARTQQFIVNAGERVRRWDYDIVHAITPFEAASVYQPRGGTYKETIARSIQRGSTAISREIRAIVRRFNRRQQFLLEIEARMLLRPEPPVIAALSDYVRRQVLVGYPGFPRQRVQVVFNGVDLAPLDKHASAAQAAQLRAALAVRNGQSLALFVAHNFKLKGLRELLGAMATPAGRANGWMLAILGRDARGPYERLVNRLDLAPRVRWLPPEREAAPVSVSAAYAAADVLVHPTWYDPCSRVVLEALGAGLPVVTTRLNGAAEMMVEGRQGYVIDTPGDVAALANAVRRALQPDVRAACSADAATLREKLSMARHARELLALYERILRDRPAKPTPAIGEMPGERQ